MKEYQYPVVIEYDPEDDVYLADCPLIPGCYTDGKTYEEALENIKDAIRLCIESRLAVGDSVPLPGLVEIAV
ncbi:MAG: type II toxin-antitoxin system HicB family antitoxin [Anaerolinea sp.]|nr:type II toxin-antitoxin system HicB family antitoxin [Anaerolinea sp.]